MTGGVIYCARNLVNGKLYIGQTTRTVQYRWWQHLYRAKNGSPYTLHRAIRKYGSDAFKIETLATCADLDTLNKLEHYFITQVFQSMNDLIGYNMRGGGDSLGSHSPESIAKMSVSQKGWKRTAEQMEKIAAANRGRKHSAEHIEKRVATLRGKKHTEETKAKIAASTCGRKVSPETRAKMSAAKTGIKYKNRPRRSKHEMAQAALERA